MQNASKAYKESMKSPYRNRGYIKVSIGIINSDAQENVHANNDKNYFTYYSNKEKLFDGHAVEKPYATCEQDWSKVDRSMYFLPKESSKMAYYNNGLVTNGFMGAVYINFSVDYRLDIKGLQINWGEGYPIDFTIENDEGIHVYTDNDKALWTTQDVFNGTTFLTIRVTRMRNNNLRLRIYEFICGIVNIFTNKEVKSYTAKEYVSPITETVPSQDTTIVVDNQNLYYSPDNPDSALSFMEVGQEIKVAFGYDVTGKEDIEWSPPTITYLKTWSATDTEAKFTGTDRFDYLTDTYYGGHYYENGVSLYQLAIDVLRDAGITDSREYFLDPYLKKVIVQNPIPVVSHAEALQIIANAGRCALSTDRQKRIHLHSSFVPDMEISSNGEMPYSTVANILKADEKVGYAVCSNDFSVVDGSLLFLPADSSDYREPRGYISNFIADGEGNFTTNPKLTIELEAAFIAYGLSIGFRNTAPQEFTIKTYNQERLVAAISYTNPELDFTTNEQFDSFTRMEIEVTKGYPCARVIIDSVLVDNVTDYYLDRKVAISDSPESTRQNKIKSINVERTLYSQSKNGTVDLQTEEIILNKGETEYVIYLNNACYDYSVSVTDRTGGEVSVTCQIVKSDNFYVVLRFGSVVHDGTIVKCTLRGCEYQVDYSTLVASHNDTGEVKKWSNPLISSLSHARDLEEWLATYFLGDVVYQIPWRGDPRVDANDLFYLETKDQGNVLIRGYENTLQFNGSWSSTIKARRAVLEWQ